MFRFCAKCWGVVEDELVVSGFEWKKSAAYSAAYAGVALVRTLSSALEAAHVAAAVIAVFMCSMLVSAGLAVYRFRKSYRQRPEGAPSIQPPSSRTQVALQPRGNTAATQLDRTILSPVDDTAR